MTSVTTDGLFLHHHRRTELIPKLHFITKKPHHFQINCNSTPKPRFHVVSRQFNPPNAVSSTETPVVDIYKSSDVTFSQKFQLKRLDKVEGKITVRLDSGESEENWKLTVGCSLPGKWILHWGVTYVGDVGREWDQPPVDMRPPGSIPIKDYAIETPFGTSSVLLEGQTYYEVTIDFNTTSSLAAINFVLKDEESGSWYQHKGRDFSVPLTDYLKDEGNVVGAQKGLDIMSGALGQLSDAHVESDDVAVHSKVEDSEDSKWRKRPLKDYYEEHAVYKETVTDNSVSVSMMQSLEKDKIVLNMETDIPSDVVVHWGVCKDVGQTWEIPAEPYPPQTSMFKNKALQTLLQQKEDGCGSWGSFILDEKYTGFTFVLKLSNTWLNNNGNDFYIPFSSSVVADKPAAGLTDTNKKNEIGSSVAPTDDSGYESSVNTDEIINEIRSLVTGISSEKRRKKKSKEAQETILQEIEKLAAEAYSIFRSSTPLFTDTDVLEDEDPPIKISSGTGSGFEILCQGFNWESHKSGKWYTELHEKASELAKLGFTVIWLPPPTDSVSPEGYMPRDLYNLNSRYGNMDQLKAVVKKFHQVGIKTLGDAVINHRCAEKQNQNGVWNIFGGRLNWDDRAVVADDPHFQGRGNKSSGDNFHAAPNIDHSQEFVRKDIKEWLLWLREEIGYDGWRLDFVRGFWGGYVKDYLESSQPYFAVGEFWDSLSYTYGEMDHNQDAHRQRIVDWINATNGTAGAFDVTTKGILHAALERCEYWRLSDEKGKPPGVLGWWPSRAVTFIENHDTGSTQGHWRFPGGKEMQGYAYILTHPGTPSVFYDHIFSGYQHEIATLISIRKRKKINCRSSVKIVKAEKDVYAAIIDEKLAMKIGPGHFEPSDSHGHQKWSFITEGRDYKIWEVEES